MNDKENNYNDIIRNMRSNRMQISESYIPIQIKNTRMILTNMMKEEYHQHIPCAVDIFAVPVHVGSNTFLSFFAE